KPPAGKVAKVTALETRTAEPEASKTERAQPAPEAAAADPEELRSLLQLHLKSDEPLIRTAWINAVHYTLRTAPSPASPHPAPEPDPPPPASLADRVTTALDQIRALTKEIDTAAADTFEPETVIRLIQRAKAESAALVTALGQHQPSDQAASTSPSV